MAYVEWQKQKNKCGNKLNGNGICTEWSKTEKQMWKYTQLKTDNEMCSDYNNSTHFKLKSILLVSPFVIISTKQVQLKIIKASLNMEI